MKIRYPWPFSIKYERDIGTWVAALLLASLSLTGCQSQASRKTPTKLPLSPTSTATLASPSQTAVLAQSRSTAVRTPIQQVEFTLTPLPSIDPLRFTFPTVDSQPVTIWRPPLYPVPWEPTLHDHFYFARPIGANEVNWPLANYRYGGVFFENIAHSGIDIPAPVGTPVMAAGPGIVMWAGYGLYYMRPEPNDPYGIAVAIKHDFGYNGQTLYTVYGHMNDYYVVRGQHVETGDIIGIVGETGKVTGPHLHFEVRVGDNTYSTARNPELWLAPPVGWGIMAARVMNTDGKHLERYLINIRSVANNRYWSVITYGSLSTLSDEYYRENMVIGDLPAGKYIVWIEFNSTVFDQEIVIQPGMVSYFSFRGKAGFTLGSPPTPVSEFIPPDVTVTPTP